MNETNITTYTVRHNKYW